MYVDLFGYRIYWTVFALITIIMVLGFLLYRIISYLRESRAVYSLSVITDWQKENIPSILRDRIEQAQDQDNILRLCNYIENNKYWNDEEITEIDEDLVIDASFMLFNEVGKLIADEMNIVNKNRAILILTTIDFMNGSLDLSSGKIDEWMDDALPGATGEKGEDPSVKRSLQLISSSIDRTGDKYVSATSEGIPLITDAFAPLRGMDVDRLADAFDEAFVCDDIKKLSEATSRIATYSLYDQIGNLLETYEGETINNYYSSYIRTLAVVLNKMYYPEIIETII